MGSICDDKANYPILIIFSRIDTVLITNPQQISFGKCVFFGVSSELDGQYNRYPTERQHLKLWSLYASFPPAKATFDPLPVDATIAFPSGLMISWQGKPLGKIKMQDINIAGDVGASLDYRSDFQVTDVDHLTKFTKVGTTRFNGHRSAEVDVSLDSPERGIV